jgi:excisionase family DNA binding protein
MEKTDQHEKLTASEEKELITAFIMQYYTNNPEKFLAHVKMALEEDATDNREFLTAREVSKLLGVSLVTLDKWRKNGTLKSYRFGSRIRYKKIEIIKPRE